MTEFRNLFRSRVHRATVTPAVQRLMLTWLADAWAGEAVADPSYVHVFITKHYASEAS